MKSEIKSEKVKVGDIFNEMWFTIPSYQRPYVWGEDQISELLSDTTYFMREHNDSDYFLGSFVFQPIEKNIEEVKFEERSLLDGQQRITTLLLIIAVIRDRIKDDTGRKTAKKYIYHEENTYEDRPERVKIVFEIRPETQNFIDRLAKEEGITQNKDELEIIDKETSDTSVKNMIKAIDIINKYFDAYNEEDLVRYTLFLYKNVMMIYVSATNLDDAFRLFTILNDRGVPLRNSDILKSVNLGKLTNEDDKKKYAKLWEEAESDLGDDFDRFLSYIRTILVKEKAKLTLLQEFEEKIYLEHKSNTNPRLEKGLKTFEYINRFLKIYKKIIIEGDYHLNKEYEFDNLIKVMRLGFPSTDWIPPLLLFYDKYGDENLNTFLLLLDNKFSADWFTRKTPTERIESMNRITKAIEDSKNSKGIIDDPSLFSFNEDDFMEEVDNTTYQNKLFAKYLLLKLDFLFQDHSHRMNHETISVEHILPQNPAENSLWVQTFTEEQRDTWTDKIGNLVLISRRKNSSQGRLDYEDKKTKYFEKNITTCPRSLRVMQNKQWDLATLKNNHEESINKIKERYLKK